LPDVLILGASGMLGHVVLRNLASSCDVVGTVRQPADAYRGHPLIEAAHLLGNVDAAHIETIDRALSIAQPKLVINCMGVIKQSVAGQDPVASIRINTLFPHELAALCVRRGCHLIHISTDCVFSGRRGNYGETDIPDAEDLYGRSKLLGEVTGTGCLTLRTSLIGRELRERLGLLEWFLSQRGRHVKGYTGAIFSGVTTREMARIITKLYRSDSFLEGLWHVAGPSIDKYNLLRQIDLVFKTKTVIQPDNTIELDRSLDGTAFSNRTGYVAPSWTTMIDELARDAAAYDRVG
jgi:dTDP-4-dehydrorhamnose reductase